MICCLGQRSVVVVGWIGGSEDQSWKHQTYLPFVHFGLLGTKGASVLQSKTRKTVRFEISEGTRASVARWMEDPLKVGSE
jgi:hypothetical protein